MQPDKQASRAARRAVLAAAGACGAATLAGLLSTVEARSYASPSLGVALETAASLVGLLAAYLVFGRFRLTRKTSDLLLVGALELIALRTVFFAGSPTLAGDDGEIFATWFQVASVIVAAGAFAAGAFAPDSRFRGGRRGIGVVLAVPFAVGVAATVESALIADLGLGLVPEQDEDVYAALQMTAAGLFAVAAVGFMRRAGRARDELMLWFAAGAIVAAFARLNYALFPPLSDEHVYSGDVLRLGFAVLLLVGALREIQAYWRHRAEAAALEERRRVARNLHDGLAQELAFVATRARAAAARAPGDLELERIATAGERALDESRRAIASLTRPVDEPLEIALAQTAEEVAMRVGVQVSLALAPAVAATPEEREALLRIAREAVGNAARHARARRIEVQLEKEPRVVLRVRDDGIGFDPDAAADGRGFGLASMRERAQALGATFRADSAPGKGTVIEVVLP